MKHSKTFRWALQKIEDSILGLSEDFNDPRSTDEMAGTMLVISVLTNARAKFEREMLEARRDEREVRDG